MPCGPSCTFRSNDAVTGTVAKSMPAAQIGARASVSSNGLFVRAGSARPTAIMP